MRALTERAEFRRACSKIDELRYEFRISLVEKNGLLGCHEPNATLSGETVTRTIIVVLAAELTAVISPRNLVGETQTCRQQCESDPFLNTSRKTRGRTSTRPCP